MKWCMMEQKSVIILAALLVGIMGLVDIYTASHALSNAEFEATAQMMGAMSHEGMDIHKIAVPPVSAVWVLARRTSASCSSTPSSP